jgi:hypothetical protein
MSPTGNKGNVKASLLAFLAFIGLPLVLAQGGDSPTFRGQNTRIGMNPDPTEPGPGTANLRWWHPLLVDSGREVVVDNAGGAPNFTTQPPGSWSVPLPVEESPDWFGSGSLPYVYAFTVPSTPGTGDPTAGATATARWVITGLNVNKYYSLWVWFPSSGTRPGGTLAPNSNYAVYKIEYGNNQEFVDIVPHLGGGFWLRLGRNLGTQDRVFQPLSATGQIVITLYNTVPRDANDQLMGPAGNTVVVADAVRAVEGPGAIYASPVVREIGPTPNDRIVVSVRNESRVDPTDPTNTEELSVGVVYALNAHPADPNVGRPRWTWSPSLLTSVNPVYDNRHPAFSADAGWTQPATPAAPGYFGTDYADAPVDLTYPGSARARWDPDLPQDGFYDIYVWFPGSGNGKLYARGARYVVRENGNTFEFFVNQDVGGQWVRLGNRAFEHNALLGGLEVEVWNFSNNPADAGRFVAADAVMFVGSFTGAIFSTPTIARVNIRKNGGIVEPTDVVFVAAEDGRIYCLDARGTGTGTTIVYWAYPSVPNINDPNWTDPNDSIDGPVGNRIPWPGSFGMSSVLVANVGGRDMLFIAAQNGRVYALDVEGRGDYDASTQTPGTTRRIWTWPDAVYNNSTNTLTVAPPRPPFVGSVAYDPATNQIFVGGTEGRLFALDAAGNGNQTTTLNWAFPQLTQPPIGALSCTPAIGGGKVFITSFDGRVYARATDGNTNPGSNWQYPPASSPPLEPFDFTSVCFVPAGMFSNPPLTEDLVFFINDNGTAYGAQASDGTILWQTPELGSGAFSSPYFTLIQPTSSMSPVEAITFGTKDGRFVALYAHPSKTNVAGTRLAWGWRSMGGAIFASPCISRQYMYHAGTDGVLYAFSNLAAPGFPGTGGEPGGDIQTPDEGGSNYDSLVFKIISEADYNSLRSASPGNPATMTDLYSPFAALEWGERLYVVAYNFPFDPANPEIIRFRLTGAGGLNIQVDRVAQDDPNNPGNGFAAVGIPLNASGQNFLTPGTSVFLDVNVLAQGTQYDTPAPPRVLRVANPLTVTTVPVFSNPPPPGKSVGWTPVPSAPENLINGSRDKAIMSTVGQVGHGSSGSTTFYIGDRSRVIELFGRGLGNVRLLHRDAEWQGGSLAVVKPLPYVPAWEEMPDNIPNLSRDYPNIDRTQIHLLADPFGQAVNPLVGAVILPPPANYDPNNPLSRVIMPLSVSLRTDVERFQPANLTQFLDASGEWLDGGYRARAIVYVDSNANGRPDGLPDTLTDLPPNPRREAFRSLNLGVSVPVDESLSIVEPTIDLGSQPHSLGYTPVGPWDPANAFLPNLGAGNPYRFFFKPFTVRNEGNVNLLDLRVALRIGRLPGPSYYPVSFSADSNDVLAWVDGSINIVSNLNPPYAVNPYGALDPSGNPRITLHKARPGDRAPTILTIPDVPYGTTPPPNSQPLIGVAVPLGFPVGEYKQLVNVIEDGFLVGGRNDVALLLDANGQPLEAYSEPTMVVKFIVRETRLTGGTTQGSVPHIDPPLGAPTSFQWTGTYPSAWRDALGNLHLVWQSNRPSRVNTPGAPQATDVWRIFFASLSGNSPLSVPPFLGGGPFRDLMGWFPQATQFWLPYAGPEPNAPPNSLFDQTPGVVVGTPQFTEPAFVSNLPAGAQQYVFYAGIAGKDDTNPPDNEVDFLDSRIFYQTFTPQAGGPPLLGPLQWFVQDPQVEKQRLRPVVMPNGRLAVFWYGEVNGVPRMFYNLRTVVNATPGNQTSFWTANVPIIPSGAFSAAWDPTPIVRPDGRLDLIFTGVLKDRNEPELFFAKYDVDVQGRLDGLRRLPERNREVLQRDGTSNTYRALGINWDEDRPIEVWLQRPGQPAVRVDIPGTRRRDDATGVITADSVTGGKVFMDTELGTVRFSTAIPGANAQVQLRYTPRVVRVTGLGAVGGSTNPSAFLDNREDWNRLYYFRSNGTPIVGGDRPRLARQWVIWERGATGPGQARRPYMMVRRLGVQLQNPIAISSSTGQPLVQAPLGMVGPFYQVDPQKGRVYFTLPDEGRSVTISYTNIYGQVQSETHFVDWIAELPEQPVPIERVVDESSVYSFPDPFFDQFNPSDPRPTLVWVFFTSTRGGTRDLYYLTLAPRLGPVRVNP